MNDIETEAAAWRLWYRLETSGPERPEPCWRNAGLTEEQYEEAKAWLMELGAIELMDRKGKRPVLVVGDNPPALIPTAGKLGGYEPYRPEHAESAHPPEEAMGDSAEEAWEEMKELSEELDWDTDAMPDVDTSDDEVLDKRHHNAPKDKNDDPVFDAAE